MTKKANMDRADLMSHNEEDGSDQKELLKNENPVHHEK